MRGEFHVRFREKFEVQILLLTHLRGRGLVPPSYSNAPVIQIVCKVASTRPWQVKNYRNNFLVTCRIIREVDSLLDIKCIDGRIQRHLGLSGGHHAARRFC